MNDDLRSYLQFVRETLPREYLKVQQQMSPHWEIAAAVAKLEAKMRLPVIEFSDVKGSQMPLITNICASLPRIAKSMGIVPAELEARLAKAYETPIPPVYYPDGVTPPVQEIVYRGDKVKLNILPQMRSTATEESAYLSAAAVVARDPDTGVVNISFHRMMIVDHCHTAIYMTPKGHLELIFQANAAQKQNTPIAVFIGMHPLWALGSLAAGGMDVDEFAVIGGLLGYPLEVTASLSDARLPVPARAEIVLEGVIHHDKEIEEGPYGEALGFTSHKTPRPLVHIHTMSTRSKPWFQEIVAGHIEHLNMTGTAVRVHLQRSITERYAAVGDIHSPGPMTLYIQLAGSAESVDIKALINEILHEQRYVKHVAVFDADVDLRNAQKVQWALATMVQADRDVLIVPDQPGNGIDPSESEGKTTKWGIDATAKSGQRGMPVKNSIPEDVMDAIDIKQLLSG